MRVDEILRALNGDRVLSERQMRHAILKVFGFASFGDEFQIVNALANCHTELMGVNDAREEAPRLLPRF